MSTPKRYPAQVILAYLTATVGVAAMLLLRAVLQPALGDRSLYIFFLPPILAAAALGGGWPSAFGSVLAVAGVLFMSRLAGGPDLSLGVFLLIGAGVSVGGEQFIVTRRRVEAALAELQEREARLQSILETAPDALVVVGEDGVIQSFSAAAERLFQWPASEAIGRNVRILMPSPDNEAHDGHPAGYFGPDERRTIATGRVVTGLRRDGSTFPMQLDVGEMRVGERRAFTGFARDLTERQLTEARPEELRAELSRISSLVAMGEVAQAFAHELNQPLTAITNFLRGSRRLLERNGPGDASRVAQALDRAAEQALRAGDTIRRLRDYVGRAPPQLEPVSVGAIVEEACAVAGPQDGRVRVTFDLDPSADPVLADRVQIEQVLVNLIRNAMEAMQGERRPELTLRTALQDGFTVVMVSDTGHGLNEEVRGRLFEPFMATTQGGMGVGLSICRTIIESHGGAIWAENNEGRGATVAFTLPSAKAQSLA
jgi:two-component system, LuxR family, sensor kinase FixL